jgi:hypothetical protein
MDKSNIAFALLSVILGLYISVALLLSRVRGSRGSETNKTRHRQSAHHESGHPELAGHK